MISHLFFDIGGVLGTNGWDHEQRYAALDHFGLERGDFEDRHKAIIGSLEAGRISLGEYLAHTVFCRPQSFSPAEFRAHMLELSRPNEEVVEFAHALSRAGSWRMATLNNESEELNLHRIARFRLRGAFTAFYSSCWLGILKPERRIYELALSIAQADPRRSVFVDDRERNLDPARALGMQVVHYTDAVALQADLAALGVTA